MTAPSKPWLLALALAEKAIGLSDPNPRVGIPLAMIPVVVAAVWQMSGFTMAAVGFLKTNPNPTREQLAHGISGNLCRCQDYDKILTAVMRGAEYMRRAG